MTNKTNTLAVNEKSAIVPWQVDFDDEKIALMKRTICKGASNDELDLFLAQCRRTGLDPFVRQIYAIRRKQWDATTRGYVEGQVIQISIDGERLIAERSNQYAGQVGPWWCGKDGEWKEVWLADEPPSAAKVGVLRHDFQQPLYAIALYKAYVQANSQGEAVSRWKTDPAGMLAKCAESLALRRAFPQELSGLYTAEEMGAVTGTEKLKQDKIQLIEWANETYWPDEKAADVAQHIAAILKEKGVAFDGTDLEVIQGYITEWWDTNHSPANQIPSVIEEE